MTFIVQVLIEHPLQKLNRPFTYVYHGPMRIEVGCRVIVPFREREIIGFIVDVLIVEDNDPRLSPKDYSLLSIISVLDIEPIINEEFFSFVEYFSSQYFIPRISLFQAILPKSLKPTTGSLSGPKIAYREYLIKGPNHHIELLSLKQQEWLNLILSTENIERKDVKSKTVLKVLLEKSYLLINKVEKRRYVFETLPGFTKHQLTPHQKTVIDQFNQTDKEVFLLEGVTGSGKTEIYIHLAEQTISNGKTVLIVVPEIALTPLLMKYFSSTFSSEVAILHSDLTDGQKYDEYRRIVQNKAKIVVGARSAIFAPLLNIGLIIIDEEHVESYKQDNSPFYHAKDVALWRGKYHHAKVLLGSATPSLETKARAEKGVFYHLKLPQRINKKEPPKTMIIDMADTKNIYSESPIFSHQLVKEIGIRLQKREQIILLVNKRGFASSIACRSCQHVFRCPHCDIPLSFHQNQRTLKCHYCDHIEREPSVCSLCQSPHLMKHGFGSQRVEYEINKLFKDAKTIRLDSDIAKIRLSATSILEKFSQQEADILIGTQMIAKGHDFENVTLVGIVLADIGLTLPHYRSTERTFQLISQAVGRTGRGEKDGLAIIQTYMPHHFAIQTGSTQNYDAFFRQEMKQRKITQYPPYTYLILIELSSTDFSLVTETSVSLSQLLEEKLQAIATMIGPNIPYPEKQGLAYRRRMLIKYKDIEKVHPILDDIVSLFLLKSSVKFSINFDPYEI
jgi:primosomal protein N' (replication factor Y) (superfamily II helicase)